MGSPAPSMHSGDALERYRTLLEINNAIITNLTEDLLLNAISQALRRAIPFDRAALTLYIPEKDAFRFLAVEGSSDYFQPGLEIGRSESSVEWVFDSQQPIVRRDLEQEQQYENERRLAAEGMRSLCVVPLVTRKKSIGTLNVASGATGQYSEADAEFLGEIANQVALAIENVKAYEDITRRKNAEEALQKSDERNRTLLEINNAIITNLTQEALLGAISKALGRVIPFDRCAITLYKPESGTFRFLAVEGALISDYFQAGLEVDHRETSAGWVFDHRQTLLRRDLEKERQFNNEDRLCAEGIHSLCVAPLIFQGKIIGTLSVVSQTKNQYSEADAQFLQEVANQVGLAIENMKSYEEIAALNRTVAQTSERLRTRLEINNAIMTNLSEEGLLRSISEVLRRVIPFDRAALTLYLPERDAFRYLGVESSVRSDFFRAGLLFDRKESISAWAFEHQQPVLRHDLEKEQRTSNDRRLVAEGFRSDCVVPLVARGKSIGTLNVGSTSKNQYSEADAEFLKEVGTQVALAVENMKAYEEIAGLKAKLEKENIYLQEEIRTEQHFEEIVGTSPALLAVFHKVDQVAPTDSTVLIHGETGTGKELIARAIHDRSGRKDRPLVKVNCSAISAGLVESELFGHVKGAFTGALERRIGRFEFADRGTIFLDEVGELPLETQVKLLRVLQEREFEPVGTNRSVRVDVRVIAATNRDLEDAVQAGRFRSDLFYRLNVFPIKVPPLRERRSDIPQLVTFFLDRFSKRFGKRLEAVAQETLERLVSYAWPGNIRELQNIIERAVVLSRGPILELGQDLALAAVPQGAQEKPAAYAPQPASRPPSAIPTLEEVERNHILAILEQTGGVIEGAKGAARTLNLHPNTLRYRMRKLGIKRHRPL
jgi:formate hydrogenlyase transcriptional activator